MRKGPGIVYDKWNISVTQIFHNGQPNHGGDRNIFEVMTSALPMQISLKYIHFNDFKHNVWHCCLSFFFTLALVETRVIRSYIRDVINYLKKGFFLERGICLVTCYLLIPRQTQESFCIRYRTWFIHCFTGC
jgi:hypothetical protein